MNEGVVQDNYLKPGGYREILKISFPLIMSTSSFSLMHVVDRIFLSWYSPESLAASMPAGAAAWSIMSLFIGTTSYVSTFVSQYDGAQRPQRIGAVIWQGIYLSLLASAILVFGFLAAEPLFNLAGHDPAVRKEEITYFNVLIVGSGGMIFSSALSAFYAGRGKTWIIMWVNMAGSLMNGVLDYFFIFGKWGFPEMGIFGAGLATVIAPWCITLFYFCLLCLRRNREQFGTLAHWRIDRELFGRLLRYGLPSGLQWMTDITAFTVFILLIGRIGALELAASNIAFAINHLLFMPMVGMSMGTSVLVGRYLGANHPNLAALTTMNAFRMTMVYMVLFSIAIAAWPEIFVAVFRPRESEIDFEKLSNLSRQLLYFVAAYSVVDAGNIVFSSALRGAGDTRFVLMVILVIASAVLVIPSFVACVLLDAGIYTAWVILTVYVVVLAFSFWARFQAGHWKKMRVIEHVPSPGATIAEGPVLET